MFVAAGNVAVIDCALPPERSCARPWRGMASTAIKVARRATRGLCSVLRSAPSVNKQRPSSGLSAQPHVHPHARPQVAVGAAAHNEKSTVELLLEEAGCAMYCLRLTGSAVVPASPPASASHTVSHPTYSDNSGALHFCLTRCAVPRRLLWDRPGEGEGEVDG